MTSFPGTLTGTLPHYESSRASRQAAWVEDWPMLRLVGWIMTTAFLAFLVWQTAVDNPLWPPAISSVLLVIVSILAGIRIGADSSARYICDLQRVNKVLANQQRELEEMNAVLLKRANSDSAGPSNPD